MFCRDSLQRLRLSRSVGGARHCFMSRTMFGAICVCLGRMPVFGNLSSLFAVPSHSVKFSVCVQTAYE